MSSEREPPGSYYAATANPCRQFPRLEGDIRCDVCVVGGGITGLSTALHLAQRGYDVALLEMNTVGWGASGRSGGQALSGFACDMSRLRRLTDAETARRLWDMSIEALALTRALILEHNIRCDLRDGSLHAAIKPRQHRELVAHQESLARDYNYSETRLLEGSELEALIDTRRYISGLYEPHNGHLHPLNYTLGLSGAAMTAGARIFEHSAALRIEEGDPTTVHTANGSVKCEYVALCGNAYLEGVRQDLRSKIMPVGTYIIATEPLGKDRATSLIKNGMCVSDINFVLDYFRLSADYRLLFGGRVSYSTLKPVALTASLRHRMLNVFPQLADVRIDYTWGGYVAITMNRAPNLGRLSQRLFFAQGFSGHGIVLTGLAGKLISEAIAGTAERFDVFAGIPHRDFPGGRYLRTPSLVLAMAWYRLRDML